MKKQFEFTLTEIGVIAVIIAITAFIVVPKLMEDNKRLDTISQWKHMYKNIEYVFSAMSVQSSNSNNYDFVYAGGNAEKEAFIFDMLSPYLRLQSKISPKDYKTYYLDGSPVKTDDSFYIENLYTTTSGNVVGLKWLKTPERLTKKLPIAILSVDLNGTAKPNRWGADIFGVNIFKNKIEPIGNTGDEYLLKADCSPRAGKGISCSFYYYIYGGKLN
ncbi:hypothetical protein IJ707_02205 [bacterium]|nr:hypothetical protein [bacterium]